MVLKLFGPLRSATSDRLRDLDRATNRIAARAALLAAAILLSTVPQAMAAGWKTQVSDGVAGRTAAVVGTADASGATGIAIACASDGQPPAQLTVAFPSGELDAEPGESATVRLTGDELRLEVIRDDSNGAMLVGDVPAIADLLHEIGSIAAPIEVQIVLGPNPVAFSIPPDGVTQAMSEIESACHL